MLLRYENTIDDLIAFQEFHHSKSRLTRYGISAIRWVGAPAVFFLNVLSPTTHALWIHVTASLMCALIWFFILPPIIRIVGRWLMRMLVTEAAGQGHLGQHELEIVDEGLIERSAYNEMKTSWGGVQRIEATPDHTFIYIGGMMAYVVPHSRILEGHRGDFLVEVLRRFRPEQVPSQTDSSALKDAQIL